MCVWYTMGGQQSVKRGRTDCEKMQTLRGSQQGTLAVHADTSGIRAEEEQTMQPTGQQS